MKINYNKIILMKKQKKKNNQIDNNLNKFSKLI